MVSSFSYNWWLMFPPLFCICGFTFHFHPFTFLLASRPLFPSPILFLFMYDSCALFPCTSVIISFWCSFLFRLQYGTRTPHYHSMSFLYKHVCSDIVSVVWIMLLILAQTLSPSFLLHLQDSPLFKLSIITDFAVASNTGVKPCQPHCKTSHNTISKPACTLYLITVIIAHTVLE